MRKREKRERATDESRQEKKGRGKNDRLEVKEEKMKEEIKQERAKEEQSEDKSKESVVITDSLLRMPEVESQEEMRAKGVILTQMKEIFGDSKEDVKEYFKFIKQHYKKGPEGVVQMWMSHLQKQ